MQRFICHLPGLNLGYQDQNQHYHITHRLGASSGQQELPSRVLGSPSTQQQAVPGSRGFLESHISLQPWELSCLATAIFSSNFILLLSVTVAKTPEADQVLEAAGILSSVTFKPRGWCHSAVVSLGNGWMLLWVNLASSN